MRIGACSDERCVFLSIVRAGGASALHSVGPRGYELCSHEGLPRGMYNLDGVNLCRALGGGRELDQAFGAQRGLPGGLTLGSVGAFERRCDFEGRGLLDSILKTGDWRDVKSEFCCSRASLRVHRLLFHCTKNSSTQVDLLLCLMRRSSHLANTR